MNQTTCLSSAKKKKYTRAWVGWNSGNYSLFGLAWYFDSKHCLLQNKYHLFQEIDIIKFSDLFKIPNRVGAKFLNIHYFFNSNFHCYWIQYKKCIQMSRPTNKPCIGTVVHKIAPWTFIFVKEIFVSQIIYKIDEIMFS